MARDPRNGRGRVEETSIQSAQFNRSSILFLKRAETAATAAVLDEEDEELLGLEL